MQHQELLMQVVDTIRRADAAAYAQLFAEAGVIEHPFAPGPMQGRAAIQEAEQGLFDAFSDIDIEVRTMLGSARHAAVELVLRATHTGAVDLGDGSGLAPTGRRVALPAVWLFEIGEDGAIVAERDYFDTASFMAQLTGRDPGRHD
jgi:steroid delta-isomerase-like uncharacterized protein